MPALPHCSRPEDRRRAAVEQWTDTTPATFRSEAFAEDLISTEPARAAAGPQRPAPRRPQASPRSVVPLLGLALAAVLGALGH